LFDLSPSPSILSVENKSTMMTTRVLGSLKLAAGAALTIGLFYFHGGFDGSETSGIRRGVAEFVAIPAVFALCGLIELIAGVKFYRVAARWDSIHEGLRWVLSALLLFLVLGMIFGLLIYYVQV
jgi:hypothetical protein